MRKWILIFTVIFLALLASNALPELRGGWGWRWPYRAPDNWTPVIILVSLLIFYVVGVLTLRYWKTPIWASLIWAILGSVFLTGGTLNIHDSPGFLLFTRTLSPVQTGASAVAVRVMEREGVNQTLEDWPEFMREAETDYIHFTTSPPGQPLLHYWTAQGFEKMDAISEPVSMALRPYQCSDLEIMRYSRGELTSVGFVGMLMPLWAGLTVIPIFLTARRLIENASAANRVSQWWPIIPSVLLFSPTWNTLYPLLVITALYFLVLAMQKNQRGYSLAAGVVMAVATLLNLSLLPIFAIFGLVTLGYWWVAKRGDIEKTSRRWPIEIGIWFGVGLSMLWIIFWLYSGNSPFEIIKISLTEHRDIAQKSYLAWVFLHPYDVLMFSGWPITGLALWGLWRVVQKRREKSAYALSDLLISAFWLTWLLVIISGSVQGETARIMIFLTPFLLLIAVPLFTQGRFWDMPLLIGQAATVAVMAAVLPVVPLDLNPQVTEPRTDLARLEGFEFHPSGATFSSREYQGEFELTQYRFVADPARQAITFDFDWRGQHRTERPYQFELVAYAENEIDGKIQSAPFYWYPQNSNYLTTCWQDGDKIADVIVMSLPSVSMPVVWEVHLRAIDERTGDKVQVTSADGIITDYATLGPINYP
ncbi:MAG: hypothetical protein K8L91_20345 [Anaerolineae bacterium]|nr:hypothetical protein [Anaerolineae bacterium]